MEMNEELKKECINICEYYNINTNFNDENWENQFIKKIDWSFVSTYICLSEDFIEKFQNYVSWHCISVYQKLSENFIEKFQDRIIWCHILESQILSENFIEKHINMFNKSAMGRSQKISKEFAKKHNIKISRYNWYQKSYRWKLKFIKENTNYKILSDKNGKYILAYKAINMNNRSFFDPKNYEYVVGKIYESNCNCYIYNYNSYGLAAWNKGSAIEFGIEHKIGNFKLILVKIYINDIGAIIKSNDNKIRCFKFEVVEDLGVYKNGNE